MKSFKYSLLLGAASVLMYNSVLFAGGAPQPVAAVPVQSVNVQEKAIVAEGKNLDAAPVAPVMVDANAAVSQPMVVQAPVAPVAVAPVAPVMVDANAAVSQPMIAAPVAAPQMMVPADAAVLAPVVPEQAMNTDVEIAITKPALSMRRAKATTLPTTRKRGKIL